MNKIARILTTIVCIVSITGCTEKIDINKYNEMKSIKDRTEIKFDGKAYTEVLWYIINIGNEGFTIDGLRGSYGDYVTESCISGLEATVEENMRAIHKEINEEVEIDEGADMDIDDNWDGEQLYPIYDDNHNIIQYGTKEEYKENQDVMDSIPLYTYKHSEVYYDRIVIHVTHKYVGEMIIIGKVDGDIITEIGTYRYGG